MTAPPRPKRRDPLWKLALAVIVPLALAAAVIGVLAGRDNGTDTSTGTTEPGAKRPNVLVIMTDDQTLESMRIMDNTKRLLADTGTTFDQYHVAFPNCCPSRATFLTGQYPHNNGVTDNVAPDGGFGKLKGDETLPVWLQRSGYYTASVGKYLNTWGQDGKINPPPGWSHWFGLIDPTTYHYYGYSVSVDGTRRDYGHEPADYQTDVLGAEVVRTITEAGKSGKPWFVEWTPLASHAQYPEKSTSESTTFGVDTMPEPAPKYKGRFANEPVPKPATYNVQDPTGPAVFQLLPPLSDEQQALIEQAYRSELETLLSVDEWVANIMDTLQKTGQLDNTTIVFTSDNGVFHGEHRLPFGKVFLYEPTTHMPLIIRGQGFPANTVRHVPTSNVDLAPTIVKLTGATPGLAMDGIDLAQLAQNPVPFLSRAVLLESWLNQKGRDRVVMKGVVTREYTYVDNGGPDRIELFDHTDDPDQATNLAKDPAKAAVAAEHRRLLDQLATCAGPACVPGTNSAGTTTTRR